MKCERCGLMSSPMPYPEKIELLFYKIHFCGKEIEVCILCMQEIRQKNISLFDIENMS